MKLPYTLASIGQKFIGELLNNGKPSTLKFNSTQRSLDNLEKTWTKQFSMPLCQYLPVDGYTHEKLYFTLIKFQLISYLQQD